MFRLGVSHSDICSAIVCTLLTLATNKAATIPIKLPVLSSKNSTKNKPI